MRTNIPINVPLVCQLHIGNQEDNKKRKKDSDPMMEKVGRLIPPTFCKMTGTGGSVDQMPHVLKRSSGQAFFLINTVGY